MCITWYLIGILTMMFREIAPVGGMEKGVNVCNTWWSSWLQAVYLSVCLEWSCFTVSDKLLHWMA